MNTAQTDTSTFSQVSFDELLPLPEKDWHPTDLLVLSFSIGSRALNEFVKRSRICDTYKNDPSQLANHVWVFLQKERWTAQPVGTCDTFTQLLLKSGRVFSVKPADNAYFHPKLTAVLYEKDTENGSKAYRLRMIVSSRNMTTEKNLEAGLVLQTETFRNTTDKALEDLLKTAFSDDKALAACPVAQKILQANFSAWAAAHGMVRIEFLTPQNGLQSTMDTLRDNAKNFAAVSPFLSDPDYLEQCLPDHTDWTIVTTPSVCKEVYDYKTTGQYKTPKGVCLRDHMICIDVKEMQDETDPTKLHAKMYAYDCTGCPDEHHLLIGSANFSRRGHNVNYELDVHLISKTYNFCTLLTDLHQKPVVCDPHAPTTLPQGFAVPDGSEFDVDDIQKRMVDESDNDLLLQFFTQVFDTGSHEPNAAAYAMDALSGAIPLEDTERTITYNDWKENLDNADVNLPDRLLHYRDELDSLLTMLTEGGSEE